MPKISFAGAGSTIFAKNILGDVFLTDALRDSEIALYDIDPDRLEESRTIIETLNQSINGGRATIGTYLGESSRRDAFRRADYVVVAIQVGGYRPGTIDDFEIPKKYGLRQTIGDTLGIGGIFRALRTIPVLFDFAKEIEEVAPEAWVLNYTNPMAMASMALQNHTGVNAVGLCHSVQMCVPELLRKLELDIAPEETRWRIQGINHMAWLLEISHRGRDLYPEIKRRAFEMNERARSAGPEGKHDDMVRFEIMKHFGYYVTESSEHNAEYTPYWIKAGYPELIQELNIPLDEYLRRCEEQIADWNKRREEVVNSDSLAHQKTHEYGADIMRAIETGEVFAFHGNVSNTGLIPNLPERSCVEVPCIADSNGVRGVHAGPLPSQCAALNMTNVQVQQLTVEAAVKQKRELAYQAAFLDPHTAAELPLDTIRSMCDDLFDAHGSLIPWG